MHNQGRKHKPRVRARKIRAVMLATSVAAILSASIWEITSKKVEAVAPEVIIIAGNDEICGDSSDEPTEESTAADIEIQSEVESRDWSADDAEILLKIAMAEAEGENTEGKALVMLVVLNRVWSDEFPDTIEEVVFQEGQFSPTAEDGRYYTTEPDEDCYAALELIESGWDESQGALYFESFENADNWHSNNLTYLFQNGNHRFYI